MGPHRSTVDNGHAIVTKYLIVSLCNVDLQVENGDTTLHETVVNVNVTVTEQLIVVHCNVNLRKKDGDTPIHYTVHHGDTRMWTSQSSSLFLDVMSIVGRTPIHFVTHNGHDTVTEQSIVVYCNVDLQERTPPPDTPFSQV